MPCLFWFHMPLSVYLKRCVCLFKTGHINSWHTKQRQDSNPWLWRHDVTMLPTEPPCSQPHFAPALESAVTSSSHPEFHGAKEWWPAEGGSREGLVGIKKSKAAVKHSKSSHAGWKECMPRIVCEQHVRFLLVTWVSWSFQDETKVCYTSDISC